MAPLFKFNAFLLELTSELMSDFAIAISMQFTKCLSHVTRKALSTVQCILESRTIEFQIASSFQASCQRGNAGPCRSLCIHFRSLRQLHSLQSWVVHINHVRAIIHKLEIKLRHTKRWVPSNSISLVLSLEMSDRCGIIVARWTMYVRPI